MEAPNNVETVRRVWVYRHTIPIRILHWINALSLILLFMSGLQIFNAHPALYRGAKSVFAAPILSMEADPNNDQRGVTKIFGRDYDTTGWLGVTSDADGSQAERGFPAWITLPGNQNLPGGRRWHFFFAWLFAINGILYLAYGFASSHFRRDIAADKSELADIPHSIWEHIRLKFPKGEAAKRYNVLQKLTYLTVIFIMLPVMVLAGLTMSPAMDTAAPWLLSIFGGRQSARTIHFAIAWGLFAFLIVHVVMVIVSGFWNNLRSMITGRYDIENETKTSKAEN